MAKKTTRRLTKRAATARRAPAKKSNERFYWQVADLETCLKASYDTADKCVKVQYGHGAGEINFDRSEWNELKEAIEELFDANE